MNVPIAASTTAWLFHHAEAWRRWIYNDYYRSYLVPL
jgi:hypothetical protein